mmetsp:Transcript_51730/g.76678  ORF Transcript_51730/g.76678 Transcript_51730/m.76678 type:complete len:240 (+) Transcript_51730:660-1379(+)
MLHRIHQGWKAGGTGCERTFDPLPPRIGGQVSGYCLQRRRCTQRGVTNRMGKMDDEYGSNLRHPRLRAGGRGAQGEIRQGAEKGLDRILRHEPKRQQGCWEDDFEIAHRARCEHVGRRDHSPAARREDGMSRRKVPGTHHRRGDAGFEMHAGGNIRSHSPHFIRARRSLGDRILECTLFQRRSPSPLTLHFLPIETNPKPDPVQGTSRKRRHQRNDLSIIQHSPTIRRCGGKRHGFLPR